MALASSVLLLGAGYVLLVAAPLVLSRLPLPGRTWDGAANGSWFPAAAASGLAIGGAAALIYVLGRLVKEVEHQPYACLAPVLGVFSAFVLAGLHVKLPMPGLLSEHFGVLAMAVAVVGGSLVQQRGVLSGLLGSLLTVLPTAVLMTILWVGSGQGDLKSTLSAMDSQVRVFAVLMSVSSLAMLAIARVARAIVHAPRAQPSTHAVLLPDDTESALWERLRSQAADSTPRLAISATPLGIPDNESYLPWSDEFPAPPQRGTPRWLLSLLLVAGLGVAGAFGFRLYQQYEQQTQAAALAQRAAEERRLKDLAAQQAVLAQRNAEQAKAAEERLNAMLNAPAAAKSEPAPQQAAEPSPAAPSAPAAQPEPPPEAPVQALAAVEESADDEDDQAAREASAERKAKRAANRAKRRLKLVKAERAEKAKVRAEEKSQEDARRSVGKTLSPSNDPILGLLEE